MRTSVSLLSLIVIAALASQLVMPAMAKPYVITIIVKESKNTPLHVPETIEIFDPDHVGQGNELVSRLTDAEGKLVLTNGVDVTLVAKKIYIIAWADFGTIGYFRANNAGGAHVTVYLDDLV